MTALRWLLRIAALLVVLIALVFAGARFHDGPLGLIPGGPLASGELVSEPVTDWSFAKDVAEIELQLVSQQRSRTVWIFVLDGKAYVPASLDFPPGKTWHEQARSDGHAVLRIDGKRYPVQLTKVEDADARLMAESARGELSRKYGKLPSGERGAWFFAVASATTR